MNNQEIIKTHRDHVFFSWVPQKNIQNPIVMDRAEGVYFWDKDGKRYLDFSSQYVNMNIGHSHPKVIAAIKDQADKLVFAHPGTATEIRAATAAKLAEITPGGLTKTFLMIL
ncbi:MAG: aminotransferase class III-fold pyridoxal phosphate-dependent enzyme [Microcoleaceae cyanobacterium]